MIDFQMINIHTGRYVMESREEAHRIIGPGGTASLHKYLLTQFNECDGTNDGFFVLLRVCDIFLDVPIVTLHADWYVGGTQETETYSDQAA